MMKSRRKSQLLPLLLLLLSAVSVIKGHIRLVQITREAADRSNKASDIPLSYSGGLLGTLIGSGLDRIQSPGVNPSFGVHFGGPYNPPVYTQPKHVFTPPKPVYTPAKPAYYPPQPTYTHTTQASVQQHYHKHEHTHTHTHHNVGGFTAPRPTSIYVFSNYVRLKDDKSSRIKRSESSKSQSVNRSGFVPSSGPISNPLLRDAIGSRVEPTRSGVTRNNFASSSSNPPATSSNSASNLEFKFPEP